MSNQRPTLDYVTRTFTTGTAKDRVIPPGYIERLSDALAAACCKAGEFARGLRDGTILFFDQAGSIPKSEWIHPYTTLRDFPLGTGIDITWAVDGQWKPE
jgi:hypothetical protein